MIIKKTKIQVFKISIQSFQKIFYLMKNYSNNNLQIVYNR